MADVVAGQASPDPNVYVPPDPAPDNSSFWQALGLGPPVAPTPPDPGADRPLDQAPATGQGYQYTEAQLHDLVMKWSDLAEKYRVDRRDARAIASVKGPGLEYASGNNAIQIQNCGDTLIATLEARENYCLAMARKCIDALGKYTTAEDTAKLGVENSSGGIA